MAVPVGPATYGLPYGLDGEPFADLETAAQHYTMLAAPPASTDWTELDEEALALSIAPPELSSANNTGQ